MLVLLLLRFIMTLVLRIARTVLREIKALGHTKMILDCDSSKLYDILEQAQQIGMMTEAHSYIATTLVTPRML